MSAKIGAARRAAFLKVVRATGNQTLAAERARVSRSWVTLQRSRDPDFDRGVREAVAALKWTPRAEERFLKVLAATGNVKAACAGVGLTRRPPIRRSVR